MELTSRVCRKAEESGALDDLTYGEMRDDLSSVWRSTKGEINTPKLGDGYWRCNTLPSIFELIVKLGLAVDPTVKRKVGDRRKKNKAGSRAAEEKERPSA